MPYCLPKQQFEDGSIKVSDSETVLQRINDPGQCQLQISESGTSHRVAHHHLNLVTLSDTLLTKLSLVNWRLSKD